MDASRTFSSALLRASPLRKLLSFASTCVALAGGSLAAMFVLSAAANATVLPPGSGGSLPDVFTACPGCAPPFGGILIQQGPTTASFNGVVLTVDIVTTVYSDPSNPFGAGKLDFIYQFTSESSSTASVSRFTATNFAGFKTDVGYTPTGATFLG